MLGLDFNDNHRTPTFKVVITTKDKNSKTSRKWYQAD